MNIKITATLLLTLLSGLNNSVEAKGPLRESVATSNSLSFVWFDANRIGAWITNEGEFTSFRITGNAGMEWPLGSGNTINFQSGIWIAGLVDSVIHTAVAEYTTEFQGGTYESFPDSPDSNRYRIFTIDDLSGPGDTDWDTWPASDGAPTDSNGDPLLLGDKMYWSVYHDADTAAHLQLFNTPPLGIEVQMTVWGYNDRETLRDVMFLNFQIFNKGDNLIEDAFVSLWSDPDIGSATDDLMGTDTLLQMVYAYNDGSDNIYGVNAPAIGMGLLQGLTVHSTGDTALFFGKMLSDHANAGMHAGTIIDKNTTESADPENATEVYNFLQGLKNGLGDVKINDVGDTTRYSFTGDPVTGEGWIDTAPNDMRLLISMGPLDFAPGDSNEIIAAVVIGQGGTASLESVTALRQAMIEVRTLQGTPVGIESGVEGLPSDFELSQNYPNPFNPVTNISYFLPRSGDISLVIYDILGKEVARPIDGKQTAGVHTTAWDASNLASGIYFYRLQAGDFVQTRKMVLLK